MSEKCLTWNVTVVAEALAGRSTKSVCSRPLGIGQRAGLDAPARLGGTPSAVTVILPYKSPVTARSLGIGQRAGFDAHARTDGTPWAAVTVFLLDLLMRAQWAHLLAQHILHWRGQPRLLSQTFP